MDPRQSYHDRVRHDVLPLLEDSLGTILDFGGGVGATSAALRSVGRASRAVLFDQVADRAVPEIDHAAALDLDDCGAVEQALADYGPFDTILALDILEHLKDPWTTVELLHQALRPGGCLIVSLPNANNMQVVGPLVLRGRFDYRESGVLDRTHLRWFTRNSALALASGSGLRVEAVEASVHGRRNRYLNRATFGVLERFLAVQYRFRARRVA